MDRDGLTYARREDVTEALDVLETVRAADQIDRALRSATDMAEMVTRRRFYPAARTMTFDVLTPPTNSINIGYPWRLWLGEHELISVNTLTSGGVVIGSSDYLLRPDDGPPFDRIELDLSSSAAFDVGATSQRAIEVVGVFGYSDDEELAGEIVDDFNAFAASFVTDDGSRIGVGDLVRVDNERMVVRSRSFVDSTATLGEDMPASGSSSVPVSDGTLFTEGETILVGAERMRIVDIAGNTLTLRRAIDGTPLEGHVLGAPIFVLRRYRVERGAIGTTAEPHTAPVGAFRHVVPPLIRDLTVAEALVRLLQERSGYARTVGAADDTDPDDQGIGLAELRRQATILYGRNRSRKMAI